MAGPGPGSPAHEHHHDLGDRLAAICRARGIAHARKRRVGTNLFGGPFRADLYLTGLPAFARGVAVVARWQEGPGSADHKIPFLAECIHAMGVPTLVVLDGSYWRPVVWDYLAARVGGPLLGALTVAEFAAWCAARGPR